MPRLSRLIERKYPPEQLAIFARCRPLREAKCPAGCNRAERCWVDLGPPAMNRQTGALQFTCVGCGDRIDRI